MGYASEWKIIKKAFEGDTGKKKPSEKFLGAIRKSSGLESATKALDKAFDSKNLADAKKAVSGFDKAKSDYQKVLASAIKAEDSTDARVYNAAVKTMFAELDQLSKKAQQDLDSLEERAHARKNTVDVWNKWIEIWTASPLLRDANLAAFISKPEFGINHATGAKDSKLAGYQSQMKKALGNYKKGLEQAKKFDPAKNLDGGKAFLEFARQVNDLLNLGGGLIDTLGYWRLDQQDYLKSDPGKKKAYESSKTRTTVDKVNEALSAENERFGKLERQFEAQILKVDKALLHG